MSINLKKRYNVVEENRMKRIINTDKEELESRQIIAKYYAPLYKNLVHSGRDDEFDFVNI